MRVIPLLAAAALLIPAHAPAQDKTRVDLYDAKSRRQGYAVVDQKTGRVDTYDKDSCRTGYGIVQPGRVEVSKPDGTRASSLVRERWLTR